MVITVESVDLLLAPVVSAQYFIYSSALAEIGKTKATNCIGYFEADVIATRKYPGSVPIFAFTLCYPKEVWILITISIIVLSFISSIDYEFDINIKIMLKYCFNYSVSLFKHPLERLITKSTPKQIIIFWLFSTFVLINHFTAYIMDFMISAVPVLRIDTMEELSYHSDMKIVVRNDDSFSSFVNEADTPLKKTLNQMLWPYDILQDHSIEVALGLRNGSLANVNKRNLLIFN